MSLANLHRVIRNADKSIAAVVRMTRRVEMLNQNDYLDGLESGIPEAQRVARQFLASNYREAGVKTRTGNMLGSLKQSILAISVSKQGSISVRVSMPTGQDKKLYIATNSVNYGRVNSKDFNAKESKVVRDIGGGRKEVQVSKAGAKRRQKLKNSVHSGSGNSRFSNPARGLTVDAKRTSKTKAGSTKVETSLGTATITKAFDFYNFRPSQQLRLARILKQAANNYVNGEINEALK